MKFDKTLKGVVLVWASVLFLSPLIGIISIEVIVIVYTVWTIQKKKGEMRDVQKESFQEYRGT